MKNPKYPCGNCGIGVKYSSIKCTGQCDQWFHGACVSIGKSQLTKMTKEETSNWKCNNCSNMLTYPESNSKNSAQITTSTMNTAPNFPSTPPSNSINNLPANQPTIDQITFKVQSHETEGTQDLETSLTLAAEVGNALLIQNNQLSEEVHSLTLKNSELTQQLLNTTYSTNTQLNTNMEHLVEELETENDIIQTRNNNLVDMLNDMESQLNREIQFRKELITNFEDIDKEKEKKIRELEEIVKDLTHKNNQLIQENSHNNDLYLEKKECLSKEKGTQTLETSIIDNRTPHISTSVLTQLIEIKSKLNHIELEMKLQKNNLMTTPKPHERRNQRHKETSPLPLSPKTLISAGTQTKFKSNNIPDPLSENKNNTYEEFSHILEENANLKLTIKLLQDDIRGQDSPYYNLKTPTKNKCITNLSENSRRLTDMSNNLITLSDDEDIETIETRPNLSKIIRHTAYNSNSNRASFLHPDDQRVIEGIKIFSFPPAETPILTTQFQSDSDYNQTCGIGFLNTDTLDSSIRMQPDTLKHISEKYNKLAISYNCFTTFQSEKGQTYIIIFHSRKLKNWKKKLFKFIELANDCFKFPILFSIDLESSLQALCPESDCTLEFIQTFLQFACNAYLHRFRLYSKNKSVKRTVDKILESSIFKHQRKISRITPSKDTQIYGSWRQSPTTLAGPNNFTPLRPPIREASDFRKAAMFEQKEIWRAKECALLKSFQQVYSQYKLNDPSQLNTNTLESLANSKDNFALLDLESGKFHLLPDPSKKYQFGFDGAQFLELSIDKNNKYTITSRSIPINNAILVSDNTQLLNDLRLYNSIKDLNIHDLPNPDIKLINGVPGCGKTTYILNNYQEGDLILFPTKDSAIDFRRRFKEQFKTQSENHARETFRTTHSFIINSSNHIKRGGKYKRLIIDEALMLHAGEILFAAAMAQAPEIILIGDTNQIPYINRTREFMVNYFDISTIAKTIENLNISYRCTLSTAALISPFYKEGMKTTSNKGNEMEHQPFLGLDKVSINKDKFKVLTFKQSEKSELCKLGYDASTIHEFQGKQAKHIAVIRTSKENEEIYNSVPHCIVAISRHTESLVYISPDPLDVISSWISRVASYTQEFLQRFKTMPNQTEINNTLNYLFSSHHLSSTSFVVYPEIHKCFDGSDVTLPTYLKKKKFQKKNIFQINAQHFEVPDKIETYPEPPITIRSQDNPKPTNGQLRTTPKRSNRQNTTNAHNSTLSVPNPLSPAFLEHLTRKTSKMKVYKTKVYINSQYTTRQLPYTFKQQSSTKI